MAEFFETLRIFFLMDIPPEILNLGVAAGLGAIIGFERDIHGRAAGLRTHLMVSLGAALFTLISIKFGTLPTENSGVRWVADPGRVAAQIVTGIGFLGAGAIIKEGFTIRGLTTAACLWVVAGIGMAAGAGFYGLATGATLLATFSLVGFNPLEKILHKDRYREITITTGNQVSISHLVKTLKISGVRVLTCEFQRDYEKNRLEAKIVLGLFSHGMSDKMAERLIHELEVAKIPLISIHWGLK